MERHCILFTDKFLVASSELCSGPGSPHEPPAFRSGDQVDDQVTCQEHQHGFPVSKAHPHLQGSYSELEQERLLLDTGPPG